MLTEETIDINAVALEIRRLDAEMQVIDAKIADFCEELGIEMPF